MKTGLLFLVPPGALSFAGHALAPYPSGVINAEPNPCRIKPGEKEWNQQRRLLTRRR